MGLSGLKINRLDFSEENETSFPVMNSLRWNYWEIGNSWIVYALRNYVWRWNPKLVFFSETKSKSRHMDRIKFKLGFSNGLCVSSRGRSGGLALLWSSDTKLEIMS